MNYNHKDWYKNSYEALKKIYHNETDLFINLLSATSPRKSVKANYKLAHNIYLNCISGLNPFENIKGLMPSHKPNVLRALKGLPLSGLKVLSFAKALMGDYNAVVIDTWIKRYFGLNDNYALTPKRYKDLSIKIKNNARRHGLKPSEYQAVIWEIERTKAGFKPVAFNEVL